MPRKKSPAEIYSALIKRAVDLAVQLLSLKPEDCRYPPSLVGLSGSVGAGVDRVTEKSDVDLIYFVGEWSNIAYQIALKAMGCGSWLYRVHSNFTSALQHLGFTREARCDFGWVFGVDIIIMPHPSNMDELWANVFRQANHDPLFLANLARDYMQFSPVTESFEKVSAPWEWLLTPEELLVASGVEDVEWEDLPPIWRRNTTR